MSVLTQLNNGMEIQHEALRYEKAGSDSWAGTGPSLIYYAVRNWSEKNYDINPHEANSPNTVHTCCNWFK
jgi:hypothetical protein